MSEVINSKNNNEKYIIEDSYLEDEIRDGFYVPSIIKRAFANELVLLHELDRICTKYNIKYFVMYGTLIGAIRHHGFVPWDDDVDIVMERKEFKRFLEVSEKELSNGEKIITFDNNDYHWKYLACLVNTEKMNFSKEYLRDHYNFPYMATIDIFILDNYSSDDKYETERLIRIYDILRVADSIESEKLDSKGVKYLIEGINKKYCCSIDFSKKRIEIKRDLYSFVRDILCEKNNEDTEYLARIIQWRKENIRKYKRDVLDKSMRVPFENIMVSVPERYDEILNNIYGNYKKKVISGGAHSYPYFENQRKELLEDVDYIRKYQFDLEEIKKDLEDNSNSLKTISKQYKEFILNKLGEISYSNEVEKINAVLGDIQQLTIDFGGYYEAIFGEGTQFVKELENLCEIIYFYSEDINKNNEMKLRAEIELISNTIEKDIILRKEIVFLSYKFENWYKLKPVYDEIINKTKDVNSEYYNAKVTVIALPYAYKEYNGALKDIIYTNNDYPKELSVFSKGLYNFEIMHPDEVYYQNVFDEYNMAVSVIPDYYVENIRKFASKLICIPLFEPDDFNKDDYKMYFNMQYYVYMPGIVLADEVWHASSKIRDRYVDKLTDLCGANSMEYWDNKNIIRTISC